ncbi:MAG TPA: hypothetical protein VMY37_14640 [Thermoguttaceae bacterium]|nr:hypothetical protein [Thermoguttaceae bacterium]
MRDAATTHRLLLFARHDLVDRVPALDGPAVLFEGAWPEGAPPDSPSSLDDQIDARFAWIDRTASRLAEQACAPLFSSDGEEPGFPPINAAWLNALALRYYLAKLVRLVAYFTEIRPLEPGDRVRLVAARCRDEDYASCMAELCRLAGASCRVEWIDRPERQPQAFPLNGRWRRGLARLCRLLDPPRSASKAPHRVVLCGNPRFLDPVCRELLGRGCRVWWLYDRFAIRSWLRWRPLGVGQLVCESSDAGGNRLTHAVPERLECRGVNLAEPVRRWLADRERTYGPRQTRIVARIDAHFRRVRPHAVVLTDDATPMARAAVALARRHGAASLVVQHGAPVCRFGFAPLSADRILVWGRSSQDQLARWGVPAERIDVVGSARHQRCDDGPPQVERMGSTDAGAKGRSASHQDARPRILLLATTPPHDDRPDAVALHLTGRTYAEMLRTALAAVSAMPGAELIVKLHPRAPDDPVAHAVLSEFPAVRRRVVKSGAVEPWFDEVDCVLSCFSSAGIDATLAGVPVIQLLPQGSGDVLPHDEWGMLGSARSEAELTPLLLQALDTRRKAVGWVERSETHAHTGRPSKSAPNPNVFADLGSSAASTIAEAILAARQPAREGSPSAKSESPVQETSQPKSPIAVDTLSAST